MIRDSQATDALLHEVRKWVRDVAIPAEDTVAESDAIPEAIVADMAQRGYFGWSIPVEYGGAGLTTEELVLAAFELSYASTAFRARVGTNTGIGSEALVEDGTDEQKRRYLPGLASGAITGCFALTEREAGSDAADLQTRAQPDGEHYILNGSKAYITNAPIAGLFTIFARTDSNVKGARGVSAFLVEFGTPGITAGMAYRKMGQAGSPVSDIAIENCRVSRNALLGGTEGTGFASAMKALNKQRIHLSALSTGPAERMLDMALEHAATQHRFGQPIGDFQLIQAMLADCRTEIAAARALILQTARKRDDEGDVRLDASMCKYFATEMCGRVADRAVQVFGGAGYVADHSVIERFYRDVRLFRLYEGTSQIHQINIAKRTQAYFASSGTARTTEYCNPYL